MPNTLSIAFSFQDNQTEEIERGRTVMLYVLCKFPNIFLNTSGII
jgi:hypothetical protein